MIELREHSVQSLIVSCYGFRTPLTCGADGDDRNRMAVMVMQTQGLSIGLSPEMPCVSVCGVCGVGR